MILGWFIQIRKIWLQLLLVILLHFFSESIGDYEAVMGTVEPKITEEDNESLLMPFTVEDFKQVEDQMHPDKSPGPDRFNPKFYQLF